jgi:serine protease Do
MKNYTITTAILVGWAIGVLSSRYGAENIVSNTATARPAEQTASLDASLQSPNSPLNLGGEILARVCELTTPSVVHIQSERSGQNGGRVEETGSGVIMSSTGSEVPYVVTNRHVVAGAALKDIDVHLADGRVIQPIDALLDEKSDIAVLKINVGHIKPAQWGDSDRVSIGHMVMAMGSPFGLSQSVTFGIISAKGRRSLKLGTSNEVINQDFLQTDAAINPGNSGGPLVNLQGQIVGINTAIASSSGGSEGIGFSIPANLAKFVVEQMLERGRVQRAYLGVKLNPEFDSTVARRLGLDRARGAHILEVYRNTPASRASLQTDDIVLSFNGIDVLDENHLINMVSLTNIQSTVKLFVLRGGQKMTLNVSLADRDELEQRSASNKEPSKSPSPGSYQISRP